MSPAHLVIMAKAPRVGRVKSRLAADIGWIAATAFARGELARLARVLGNDPRWRCCLAVAPDAALGSGLWPAGPPRIAQGAGDLGRRMGRVMAALPPGPAVIVGADCPDLGPGEVAHAFAALRHHDAVLGPALDGGYYLVGLKRTPRVPDAFAGVRWSGPHALADTLANLGGLRVALLPPLADIDTGADWARWRARERRPDWARWRAGANAGAA